MRELKFRYTVKRTNGHIFSEIFTMKQIEQGEALLFLKINNAREKDVSKEQYIDNKDKNGVEIYEGDIIALYPSKEYEQKYTVTRLIDEFHNGWYLGYDLELSSIRKGMEIISNIHEEKS